LHKNASQTPSLLRLVSIQCSLRPSAQMYGLNMGGKLSLLTNRDNLQ